MSSNLTLKPQVIHSDIPNGSLDAANRFQKGIANHAALINATTTGGKRKRYKKTYRKKIGGSIVVPMTVPAPTQGQMATIYQSANMHANARSAATYDSDLKTPDAPRMGVIVTGGKKKYSKRRDSFSKKRRNKNKNTRKIKKRKI